MTDRVAAVGVIGIVAVGPFAVADAFLRVAFDSPIRGLSEITQPLMALGVAACLPAGVIGRVNISINAAQTMVPKAVFAWFRVPGAAALPAFLVLVSARRWACPGPRRAP